MQTNLICQYNTGQVPLNVSGRIEYLLATIPEDVLTRYQQKNNLSRKDARAHYRELMRFFLAGDDERLVPSLIVDEAWHNFVLFTREYGEWCRAQFGRFIHHVPTVSEGEDDTADYNRTVTLLVGSYNANPDLWPDLAACGTIPNCGQHCTSCGKK